jgi:ProP effector
VSSPKLQDPILIQLSSSSVAFRETRPLAIGIHKAVQLEHPEIDKTALKTMLKRYTTSTKYLKAVAAGGSRYDMEGNAVGEVTLEQQTQANETLLERFRKQAERHREAEKDKQHQAKLQQLADKFKRNE